MSTPGAENEPPRGTDRGGSPPALRLAIVTLWTLALLQGAVFVATGSTGHRVIGLLVAVATCVVALRPLADRWHLAGLVLLATAGCANFIAHLTVAVVPFPLRLLQAAVLYGYASLCLAAVGSVAFRRFAAGLLVSALTMTFGLVAAEAGIEAWWPPIKTVSSNVLRWDGGAVPHPVLEDYYPPNTEARTIYAGNPREYFRTGDPRLARWKLGINHKGSTARLVLPGPPASDAVRVEIDRAEVPTPWHVQLSYSGVGLRKGRGYVVAFRIRADRQRSISYFVGEGHPPWQTIGLYRDLEVGTTWRDHVQEFTPTETDDEARLSFNFGATTGGVEIAGVAIRSTENGASAVRALPVEYAVSYRFNNHGCRGPDYVTPSPPNRRRILVLGDSYALGVGVHEGDTFSAQLQTLLNAGPSKSQKRVTYDIINCGVYGYSTRQERQLFEILGPVYRPEIVIATMVFNDDRSFRSEVNDGYIRSAGKYERLSLIWAFAQYARHEGRKPPADFSGSLEELRLLKGLCDRMNARLVVVAFRNMPLEAAAWGPLVQTISAGLAGTGVPWLDLGDRLLADRAWESLVVYPDVDWSPNEVAHRNAAGQLAGLLKTHGLVR